MNSVIKRYFLVLVLSGSLGFGIQAILGWQVAGEASSTNVRPFVSRGLLAQNSTSIPEPPAPDAQIADFRGIWAEQNPLYRGHPMRLLIVQNKSTLTVYSSYTQEFGGNGDTAVINQDGAVWKQPLVCPVRFWEPGYNYDAPGFYLFRLSLEGTTLKYEQETHWLVPCKGHPEGVEKVTRELARISKPSEPLEAPDLAGPRPEPPGAQSTDFSGVWIQDHPNERPHPMRLQIVRNASTLTVWISYTQKFSGPGFTATLEQGEAMWKEPQGCAERFRQPGYNYDNPGFNTFRLRLQGAALEYEQETHWLAPCDGHPVGVEKVTKELWRTSEQVTSPEQSDGSAPSR